MERLVFSDLITKMEVKYDMCEFYHMQHNIIQNTPPQIPEMTINPIKETIKLDDMYSGVMDDVILLKRVQTILEKTPEILRFPNVEKLNYEEQRKIITTIYVEMNKIHSINRRPGNSIIVDEKSEYMLEVLNLFKINNFDIKLFPNVGDNIIVYSKPENNYPHFVLAHNNYKYGTSLVSGADDNYSVIKIECMKTIRINKLKRICE